MSCGQGQIGELLSIYRAKNYDKFSVQNVLSSTAPLTSLTVILKCSEYCSTRIGTIIMIRGTNN